MIALKGKPKPQVAGDRPASVNAAGGSSWREEARVANDAVAPFDLTAVPPARVGNGITTNS